jgi:hypothetical protein
MPSSRTVTPLEHPRHHFAPALVLGDLEHVGSPGGVETMNAEDFKEAPNRVGRSGASFCSLLAAPDNIRSGNRRSQESLYSGLTLEKSWPSPTARFVTIIPDVAPRVWNGEHGIVADALPGHPRRCRSWR